MNRGRPSTIRVSLAIARRLFFDSALVAALRKARSSRAPTLAPNRTMISSTSSRVYQRSSEPIAAN